jgi:hypothetical protein
MVYVGGMSTKEGYRPDLVDGAFPCVRVQGGAHSSNAVIPPHDMVHAHIYKVFRDSRTEATHHGTGVHHPDHVPHLVAAAAHHRVVFH